MKKKTKFMTAIISRNEWNLIKVAMINEEKRIEDFLTKYQFHENSILYKCLTNTLNQLKHFNSISVDSIEELADKIEKQRRKEKKSGKKDSKIHFGKKRNSK